MLFLSFFFLQSQGCVYGGEWCINRIRIRAWITSLCCVSPAISLECYSCSGESSDNCNAKQQCDGTEDSCLKLTSNGKALKSYLFIFFVRKYSFNDPYCRIDLCWIHVGMIYAGCMRYSDCNFQTLGSKYVLPEFTFSCCQSNLCNKEKKKNWFWDLFG